MTFRSSPCCEVIAMAMTAKEYEVYRLIVDYTLEKGFAPSVREICEMAGFRSSSTGHKYIHRLCEEKKIWSDGRPRAIKLLEYKLVRNE